MNAKMNAKDQSALSLRCANCGAPLEIAPELDEFACAHCGTLQQVERSGGIVALRRVVRELKELRSGTDRAAAELALRRLDEELSDAHLALEAALSASAERRESDRRGRRTLTKTTFLGLLVGGPLGIAALSKFDGPLAVMAMLPLLWLFALVAGPITVFCLAKISPDDTDRIRASFEPRIQKIRNQILENQEIVDRPR